MILTSYLIFFLIFILGFISTFTNIINFKYLKIVCNTLGRDLKVIRIYLKILSFVKGCHRNNQTVVELFHKRVEKHPHQVCFVFEGEEWTYKQINDFSNKVARCFDLQQYKKGDEIALFMENCPEFLCIYLGLAKIGVITALINTQQKAESLAYTINVINAKGIIVGHSLIKPLKEAMHLFNDKEKIALYCYSRKYEENKLVQDTFESLNALLDEVPSTPLDPVKFKANIQDKMLYVYTSGTTGYPKPAIIRHSRYLWFCAASRHMSGTDEFDIIYNTLPMYHTAGGILFVSNVLIFGGKMILKKKFSAQDFWKDVNANKVTVCQYIGELCRYLVNTPPVPEESQHNVRVFFGNGLKSDVWEKFQKRSKIPMIREVYGSTEGNATAFNITGNVGYVGHVSRIFSFLYPIRLIKVNTETGEALRDKNGFCICCKPGEPGEIIGKVERNNPWKAFDGYVNAADTQSRILKDCFQKGDTYFASGDILSMDEYGYMSFVDRGIDTFRWKGENVATIEVENTINTILNLPSCVVYGVKIPGTEGRAGMATIQKGFHEIDFSDLYKTINEKLPGYAVPFFLRICNFIEITGTFKLRKVNLCKEGYNPEEIRDPLYFIDHEKQTYIPLRSEVYSDIIKGKIKL